MELFLKGILVAVVGGLVTELIRFWVLPRIDIWRPTGGVKVPDVRGKWHYHAGVLEIKQIGTRITAEAIREDGRFKYKGRITGGQLILSWEKSKGAGYIEGAMVLRMTSDINKLEGMTVFVAQDEAHVVARERTYTREED